MVTTVSFRANSNRLQVGMGFPRINPQASREKCSVCRKHVIFKDLFRYFTPLLSTVY